jgi:hypothetical protein
MQAMKRLQDDRLALEDFMSGPAVFRQSKGTGVGRAVERMAGRDTKRAFKAMQEKQATKRQVDKKERFDEAGVWLHADDGTKNVISATTLFKVVWAATATAGKKLKVAHKQKAGVKLQIVSLQSEVGGLVELSDGTAFFDPGMPFLADSDSSDDSGSDSEGNNSDGGNGGQLTAGGTRANSSSAKSAAKAEASKTAVQNVLKGMNLPLGGNAPAGPRVMPAVLQPVQLAKEDPADSSDSDSGDSAF